MTAAHNHRWIYFWLWILCIVALVGAMRWLEPFSWRWWVAVAVEAVGVIAIGKLLQTRYRPPLSQY